MSNDIATNAHAIAGEIFAALQNLTPCGDSLMYHAAGYDRLADAVAAADGEMSAVYAAADQMDPAHGGDRISSAIQISGNPAMYRFV